MTPFAARAAPRSLGDAQRRRLTLLAMCVATFMIQLDVTIVNVALPAIQRDLQVTPGDLEWVISGYALALAALIPVGGALGDRYGRRRIFLVGVVVFALGSTACALAPNAPTLVAFRVLQGVGGAAMLALTLSILTDAFPPPTRAAAIGTWAAIGGSGFGVGPVAGGVLLSFFGWSSVFWVNVPIAAVAVVLTLVAVAESRNPAARRLDGPGVVASSLGLVGITFGLIESASNPWGSGLVAGPLVAGGLLVVVFVLWERCAPHPMLPPSLLGARSFVSASGIYLLSYTAVSAVLFFATLLYQNLHGWSALRTGLSWLLLNAPFLAMAQLTGRIDRRHPPARVVASGCIVAAVGIFLLSRASTTSPFLATAIGYLLAGAGFGVVVPGVTHVAMRDVPAEVSGAASSVVNAARQLGTSIGLAVIGSIGVTAATTRWMSALLHAPRPLRVDVARQAANVAGARIGAVTRALGPSYRHLADESFVHGYQLALGVAAVCLLAGAGTALFGFHRRWGPRRLLVPPVAGKQEDALQAKRR